MIKSTHARDSKCYTHRTRRLVCHDVASDRLRLEKNGHIGNTCTPTGQSQGLGLSSFLGLLAGAVLLWHQYGHGHLAVGYGHHDGVEPEGADHLRVYSPYQDTAHLEEWEKHALLQPEKGLAHLRRHVQLFQLLFGQRQLLLFEQLLFVAGGDDMRDLFCVSVLFQHDHGGHHEGEKWRHFLL